VVLAPLDGGGQLVDRLGLISGGRELGHDTERGHPASLGPAGDTPYPEPSRNESTKAVASATCGEPAGAWPTTWKSRPFAANRRTS
jgi:hypothetical protein